MKTKCPTPIIVLALCLCVLVSCSRNLVTHDAVSVECPLVDQYESRLVALEGPLGCTATETLTPNPPDGCEGAREFLEEVRANLAANLEANGCSDVPVDLSSVAAAYDERFTEENSFVEHEIGRDGMTIVAREYGELFSGEGPTIVLMHGFPDNKILYDRVAPALGETQHTITFDFIGFGQSDSPEDISTLTFEGLRADIEAVLDYFSVTHIVPVVHDMSGWPGIDWALDNADRVTALVLLNTGYNPAPGTAPPYVIRALMAADMRSEFLELTDDVPVLSRSLYQTQVGSFFVRDDLRETYLPIFAHIDGTVSGRSREVLASMLLDEILERIPIVPRMERYDRPVFIVFGAEDPNLNEAPANAFAETFPNATLELIEGAGHYVQMDASERVVEVVRDAATR